MARGRISSRTSQRQRNNCIHASPSYLLAAATTSAAWVPKAISTHPSPRRYLHGSIERQFAAFERGFRRLCKGPTLALFRAEELEQARHGATRVFDIDSKIEQGFRTQWSIMHFTLCACDNCDSETNR